MAGFTKTRAHTPDIRGHVFSPEELKREEELKHQELKHGQALQLQKLQAQDPASQAVPRAIPPERDDRGDADNRSTAPSKRSS